MRKKSPNFPFLIVLNTGILAQPWMEYKLLSKRTFQNRRQTVNYLHHMEHMADMIFQREYFLQGYDVM